MPGISQIMIRFASALFPLALVAAPPLAAQAARDFQLPPAGTPTADTRVQGPVDPEAPVPAPPRAIATERPPPEPAPAPAPAPRPSATERAAPAVVFPTPASTRPVAPRQAPARTPPPQTLPTAATALAPPLRGTASRAAPTPPPVRSTGTNPLAPVAPEGPERSLLWAWLALGGAALAAGASVLALRRRGRSRPPEIVAPRVPLVPPAEVLALAVEAVRLDRSMLNATVGYRITVRNRSTRAIGALAIEADLVSASSALSAEQQLASPGQALTPRHSAERLAPGQSLCFEGQARLPLTQASAIWQGTAALLIPLLRVRALAADVPPIATTLVIGRREGAAARPQPFRLDEPPRSYAPLAQRVLDAVPARA